jgi:hypothetical protein
MTTFSAGDNLLVGGIAICVLAACGIWLDRSQSKIRFPTLRKPFADHIVKKTCPKVRPLRKGSCETSGRQCMRISTPNHAPDLDFDTLIVSDNIHMSVKVLDRSESPSLDITADAAVMDHVNIDWNEMQKGFFRGRRTLSLSLAIDEPWDDCHFDVNVVLEVGVDARFSYIEAANARISVDSKALSPDITVRASGDSHITTSRSSVPTILKKVEAMASGDSILDIHQVPLDYAKVVANDRGVVTIKANKRVEAQCSDQAYIAVLGKPSVQKRATDDCEIRVGWTSWAKGMLRRLVSWAVKSIGMAIGLRFLIGLVVICGLLSVFGCAFLVPTLLLFLIFLAALLGVFLMASDFI